MNRSGLKSAGTSALGARRKLYALILAAVSAGAQALPQGGQVVAGDAVIELGEGVMDVHQTSQRAVLHFDDYSLGRDQTIHYHQPNADAVALNRVLGDNLSEIHGTINANGHVYLINPRGVLFGQGAELNVGGLVATTLDIRDADFLAGGDVFGGAGDGRVENLGQIRAQSRVVLLAPEVVNRGDIQVPGGDVTLRSSRQALLHTPGSGIPILLEQDDLVGQVVNEGSLQGERVTLALDGRSRDGLIDAAINQSGLIRATRASGDGGVIELLAPGGDVVQDGTLNLAGAGHGSGGSLQVTAQRYAQAGTIDARGQGTGDGGQVAIHADRTVILHGQAQIDASGGELGHGGEVIVYADGDTWYLPEVNIRARGGELAGDGGFVEVSGREFIQVEGLVDVGANLGRAGLWYIDPTNINIGNSGATDGSFVGPNPFTWVSNQPPPPNAFIHIDTILNTLRNNGDVMVDTASTANNVGDISFAASLNFDGVPLGRTLTLTADRDINVQGGATIFDSNPGTEGLNVVFNAGRHITFNNASVFNLGTGTFTAEAEQNIRVTDITSSSTSDLAINLRSRNGQLLDDGENNTGLRAANGGIFLGAATGIGLDDIIELDTTVLGIENTVSGDVNAFVPGDLTITSLRIGSGMTFSLSAGGDLYYTGTTGGNLQGAVGSQIDFSAMGAVYFNALLADTSGANDHSVDVSLTAGSGIFMTEDAGIEVGGGTLSLLSAAGDIEVAGLVTLSAVDDAIRIELGDGALTGVGDGVHLSAVSGGVQISAAGGISNLNTQIDRLWLDAGSDVVLQNHGDLQVQSLNVVGLAALGTVGDLTLVNDLDAEVDDLQLTASGDLYLPQAGLAVAGSLQLAADDIIANGGGRTVSLTADSLYLSTAASGGDLRVDSSVNELTLINSGSQLLEVFNAGALALRELVQQDGATHIASGGGEDLTLLNSINLQGVSGSVTLESAGDLRVEVDLVDPDQTPGHATDLQLLADQHVLFAADARVDAGAGGVEIHARNGRVELGEVWGETLSVIATGAITAADPQRVVLTGGSAQLQSGAAIGEVGQPLRTSAERVDLGAADSVHIANQGDLLIDTLSVGGDLHVSVLGSGDVTLTDTAKDLAGDAFFELADGVWHLPVDGWQQSGDLYLSALGITASGGPLDLRARNAELNILGDDLDVALVVDFDELVLRVAGTQSVSVEDLNELTLSLADLGGDLTLAAAGNLQVLDAQHEWGANLSLSAGGDLALPDTGLAVAGELQLSALNLVLADGTLQADHLLLNLASDVDTQINTQINSLALAQAGGQHLSVQQSGALSVQSLVSDGDVALAVSGGDLTVNTAQIHVAGLSSWSTDQQGRVLLASADLAFDGDWQLDAHALQGSTAELTLAARHAQIRIRDGAEASEWATQFERLGLDYLGAGAVSVTNQGALELLDISVGGDLDITTLAGDLRLGGDLDVLGALTLATAESGDLVLADSGLQHSGALALTADRLVAGAPIVLAAPSLQIELRDSNQAAEWQLDTTALALQLTGAGALSLINSGDLILNSLVSDGAVSLHTPGDLALATDTVTVDGLFELSVDQTLTLTAEGLNVEHLQLVAGRLLTEEGADLRFAGQSADLQVLQNEPLALTTDLDQLSVTYGGSEFSLHNSRALTLDRLDVSAAEQVGLRVDGLLNLPQQGLIVPGALDLRAQDLLQAGTRELDLSASTLAVRLSQSQGDHLWRVAVDSLDASLRGQSSLTVAAEQGLTLADLNGDGHAIMVEDGNFVLHLASGDLVVAGNMSAADLTADGVRTGRLDLNVAAGDIRIEGPALLISTNNVDRDADPGLYGISLRLTDTSAAERTIHLGASDDTAVALRALGGDILLDTRPQGTDANAVRRVIQHSGVTLESYNQPSDPLNGTVLLNGNPVAAAANQWVRTGRTLALVMDVPPVERDWDGLTDAIDQLDGVGQMPEPTPTSGAKASAQFERVFGSCDELDRHSQQRCRIESALKAFLSHWLVGGEMPPKTELR